MSVRHYPQRMNAMLDWLIVTLIIGPVVAKGVGLVSWPDWLISLPMVIYAGTMAVYVLAVAIRRG